MSAQLSNEAMIYLEVQGLSEASSNWPEEEPESGKFRRWQVMEAFLRIHTRKLLNIYVFPTKTNIEINAFPTKNNEN